VIAVSNEYQELVKSNIRPKCEPIIRVFGTDEDGQSVEIFWGAGDIKDLSFKRGIDPIGRELPYMELTWTEIYTGVFDAENYPEKYNNVVKYMSVELSFVQNLGFYNNWSILFNTSKTWGEIFERPTTWQELKSEIPQEIITMPRMFLSATPTVKGKTITWTARDFLFFCDRPIKKATAENVEIPFFNPFVPEYGDYITARSAELIATSDKTWVNFQALQEAREEHLTDRIFVDSTYSNFFLNYLKLKNYFPYFEKDGSVTAYNLDGISQTKEVFINRQIMYSLPQLTKEQNVSNYIFSFVSIKLNESQNYEVEYYDKYEDIYSFKFNGFGEAQEKFNPNASNLDNAPNALEAVAVGVEKIIVTPLSFVEEEDTVSLNSSGIGFKEKNPINPYSYSQSQEDINYRMDFFKKFFNQERYIISCETLPILMIEPCDVVYSDRCLSDLAVEEGAHRQSIITEIDISYNGALRQKIVMHECPVGHG
jgi:hypothetical protein